MNDRLSAAPGEFIASPLPQMTTTTDDEQLAWKLQMEEMQSDELRGAGQRLHQEQADNARHARHAGACRTCGRGFLFSGRYIVLSNGERYHAGCLRCAGCAQAIRLNSNGASTGALRQHEGSWYHAACASRLFDPVCACCGTTIAPDAGNGRILFKQLPFWDSLKFCLRCTAERRTRCFACDRWQLHGKPEHTRLGDGRLSCVDCSMTAIIDSSDARPLYEEVAQFFSTLGMRLDYLPPLMLVDVAALNETASSSRTVSVHDGCDAGRDGVWTTRGLTLSEETTVRTVERSVGGLFGHRPQRVTHSRSCDVTVSD